MSATPPSTSNAGRRNARPWAAPGLCFAFALVLGSACGTDAVGVDSCRRIEAARCRAAAACEVITPSAGESCVRFYRDQCLHGLPVDDPGERAVGACVDALDAIGSCAASRPDDPQCVDGCRGVSAPETLPACAFLGPNPDNDNEEEPDPSNEGGAGGSGGSPAEGGEPAGAGGLGAE